MSIEAITIALNHSKAKGSAKIVLLGICNHISPDNDGAWPSQERLANYANITDRAVRYAIEQLVSLGEIRFEVAAGDSRGQYKPNRYWLTLTCPDDCDKTASHRRVEKTDRVEVSDIQGGKNLQLGWKQASDKPYIEPLVRTVSIAQTEFEQFWNVYPRKVGKDDAKAALVKALKRESFDIILAGVIRFAHDPNKPSKEFLPYPATWLNRGSWDDEPYPERTVPPAVNAEMQVAISKQKLDRDRELTKQMLDEQRKAAENIEVTRCVHNRIIFNCPDCR